MANNQGIQLHGELQSIIAQAEQLSVDDQVQLIRRLVDAVAKTSRLGASGQDGQPSGFQYALDLLEASPGARLFRTSSEADEYLLGERQSWDR